MDGMTASPNPARRRCLRRIASLGLAALSPLGELRAEGNATQKPVLMWGKRGSGSGEFASPLALAHGPRDEIFVADALNRRVQVFRPDGTWIRTQTMTVRPSGIAVDLDGLLYVADWETHGITVYARDGRVVRQWGRKGTGPGEFRLPGGLAFDLGGTLYVADSGNARIQAFNLDGVYLRMWGTQGSGPSQFGSGWEPGTRFAGPQFVAVDGCGRVYATDAASHRVQRFSEKGRFEWQWRNSSSGPGGFGPMVRPLSGPIAICADPNDGVWVGAVNSRIQHFDANGQYLRAIGECDSDSGQR